LEFYFTSAMAAFPGFLTEITPFHIHWHVQLSVRAGFPKTFIFALPGAQGAVTDGTQGIGVNTPAAAVVACITVGFVGDEHIPKEGMFEPDTLSAIVATGILPHFGRIGSATTSDDGIEPKVHWSIAPVVTNFPINPKCS